MTSVIDFAMGCFSCTCCTILVCECFRSCQPNYEDRLQSEMEDLLKDLRNERSSVNECLTLLGILENTLFEYKTVAIEAMNNIQGWRTLEYLNFHDSKLVRARADSLLRVYHPIPKIEFVIV